MDFKKIIKQNKNELLCFLGGFAFFLICITLLQFIWFGSGQVILGHDSGFSLNAEKEFKSRFSTWSSGKNFGVDYSAFVGSWFIHLVDYIGAILVGQKGGGNVAIVLFWFITMYLSFSALAIFLAKRLKQLLIIPLMPFFLIFNFFIFQSVFIFERTKYSIFITLALFLLTSFLILERKISVIRGIVFTAFVFFIFNGGGWAGAPLFGSILVAGAILYVGVLLHAVVNRKWKLLGLFSIYLFFSAVATILLDAYSVLPMVYTSILPKDNVLGTIGGLIEGHRAWLDSVSKGASMLNLFRMQGAPEWYAPDNAVNYGHSLASIYLTNPILIMGSILIPVFSFFSLLLVKSREEKKYVYYFLALVLLGMFFSAGSHSPTTNLFVFFFNYVPGFGMFRSAYFKFSPTYILGMSILLSYSLAYFITWVSSNAKNIKYSRIFLVMGVGIVLFLWTAYHYKFFTKDLFKWEKNLTTLVTIPAYSYEFEKWAEENIQPDERILLLPRADNIWNAEIYTWGYWSLAPLQHSFTDKTFLLNDTDIIKSNSQLISQFYDAIEKKEWNKIQALFSLFQVHYVLFRNDIVSGSTSVNEALLSEIPNLKKERTFGKWVVYSLENKSSKKIYGLNTFHITSNVGDYFDIPYGNRSDYAVRSDIFTQPDYLDMFVSDEVIHPNCLSCIFEQESIEISPVGTNILPGSLFYNIKLLREKQQIENARTDEERINLHLGLLQKRSHELYALARIDKPVENFYSISTQFNDHINVIESVLGKDENTISPVTIHRTYDYLLYIENEINKLFVNDEYVKNSIFLEKFEKVVSRLQSIRENLNRKYFTDILTKKVYEFSIKEPGTYSLYLEVESLPKDTSGKPILPNKVSLTPKDTNSKEIQNINFADYDSSKKWITADANFSGNQKYKAELVFPTVPSFNLNKSVILSFPGGEKQCIGDNFSFFKNSGFYKVTFTRLKEEQKLQFVYLENDSRIKNVGKYFRPTYEKTLPLEVVTELDKNFIYYYKPSMDAKNVSFYICSQSFAPEIASLAIHQIYEPKFLMHFKNAKEDTTYYDIPVQKINPTEYRVSPLNNMQPYILVLSEAYSPFWEMHTKNGEKIDKHFKLNGYANAWVVASNQKEDLLITYTPQKIYNIGVSISLVTVITLLSIFFLKNLKNHEI